MILILIAAVLPAFVLLYFIYRKDKLRKEPANELIKGFAFGAVSAFLSFLISTPLGVLGFYPAEPTTFAGHVSTALFAAAVPEELAKLFMLWLLLRRSKHFDEYVDGIVYAACVGMGFAALENIMYLFANMENWAEVGALRALCSVPGHFFFAVMMGFFYSKAMLGDPAKRNSNLVLAALVPIALHAAFDALLMVSSMGAGIAAACIVLFIGLYAYMALTTRKRFKEHLAIDEVAKKVDDTIAAELADAADGKRDNPVGDVVYLPSELPSAPEQPSGNPDSDATA